MFFKEFEIRWSDLDANRHLGNSTYIEFASHTRMSFLERMGFNQESMLHYNMGPVAFYEHLYYFREVFVGQPVKVTTEFKGMSEDGMFFEFSHDYYDGKGRNFARCEMMGGWMDLGERKLIGLPTDFLDAVKKVERSPDFKILTKADTRKYARAPKDFSKK